MPYKSRRPCGYPGCAALVSAGERYCDKHKKTVRLGGNNSHYDRHWQKIRALYLANHPLCVDCQKEGRLTPATEVHHIVKVKNGGSDREDNLMALCHSCHSRRTQRGE